MRTKTQLKFYFKNNINSYASNYQNTYYTGVAVIMNKWINNDILNLFVHILIIHFHTRCK